MYTSSNGEFNESLAEMEQQFLKRDFVIAGEIFEVFGLRLFLSENHLMSKDKMQIVQECGLYLDDLRQSGKIRDKAVDIGDEFELSDSYGGYAFYNRDLDEFKRLVLVYEQHVEANTRERLPEHGARLLQLMTSDSTRFFRQLCLNNIERSPFFDFPVLASIHPSIFCETLFKLHPSDQKTVYSTLKTRYEGGKLTA